MPTGNSTSESIFTGLCKCGCGFPAPIATRTSARNGWVKGQPMQFVQHHDHLVNGRSKVDWLIDAIKAHGDSDACLLWPFFCNPDGYGIVAYNGRNTTVHRLAYKIAHGDFPHPCGRHSCDVRNCANPRHVLPGSQRDNVQDMVDRNRTATGEDHSKAVLNERQVRAIREKYAWYSVTMKTLAHRYGVDQHTIHDIIHRKTWKNLT